MANLPRFEKTDTLDEFNGKVALQVRDLWQTLNDAGHPVSPEEAKVLWTVGHAALAECLGLDEGAAHLTETAKHLAKAL